MLRSQKRLLLLLAALPLLVVSAAILYMLGMSILEGQPRGFWKALAWAAETLSTTGYGADHTWTHPLMVIFVVALQFLGVFLIFLIFPVYLIPFLEERFEVRLPKEAPDLTDHVIIFRYGAAVATLLEELKVAGHDTVVVEPDEFEARRLIERGYSVVHGSLEDDLLERARLSRARALVANGSDDENATVILGARQMGFSGEAVALVENPFHRKPIMLAGATAAYTPRHILGAALAARASQRVSPTVAGAQQIGRKLRVSEMKITPGSELAGKTLAEAELGRRTGVTVIGQWVEGKLVAPANPDLRLVEGGIMILVGSSESLERLEKEARGALPLRREGSFIVAGYGEVGRKVVELLHDVEEEVRVIDREPAEGVDVVGDVLDPGVLESASVSDAQAVILAPDTDSATLFATVIVKDVAPDVPVIARVNGAENVEKIHRAGADFVLSISQVSGQLLARRLLGEESISVDPQLKVRKVSGRDLEGRHPADLDIRERTGCSVVAVERGDELVVEFDDEFRFQGDDAVYICGAADATRTYGEVFRQESG